MSTSPIINKNKVIVITGANRGIGLELCKQLLLLPSNNEEKLTIYALCRKSSGALTKLASKDETTTTTTATTTKNEVRIIEDVDVMSDDIGKTLRTIFGTDDSSNIIPIHELIHNAGAYGPPLPDDNSVSIYETQTLSTINSERMMYSYRLNAVAPLLITKALVPNLSIAATTSSPSSSCSKVIIISSGMGSLTINTSGGHYGYRASKAAVNQIGRSLAADLKQDNIAVGLIHPGFVHTEFGGTNAPRHPGSSDVDVSVQGVLEAIDAITLQTTGTFLNGNYGKGITPLPW